jgi:hypothetical protein
VRGRNHRCSNDRVDDVKVTLGRTTISFMNYHPEQSEGPHFAAGGRSLALPRDDKIWVW